MQIFLPTWRDLKETWKHDFTHFTINIELIKRDRKLCAKSPLINLNKLAPNRQFDLDGKAKSYWITGVRSIGSVICAFAINKQI